ncbi:MAG TPA: hypothetical protein VM145_02360 [Sphingomicrobium sp.]|nr:hypothetical protein [Sphingomicrobium sp.]
MHRAIAVFLIATLVPAPSAAASPYDPANLRPGAFAGVQLKVPLGHAEAKPRAELTFAPTRSQISRSGQIRTQIGEGVSFGLSPESKPTLTIAGTRADAALGLQRGPKSNVEPKLGISTAGWVAIGVGVAALAAGAYFVHLVHEADKNSD